MLKDVDNQEIWVYEIGDIRSWLALLEIVMKRTMQKFYPRREKRYSWAEKWDTCWIVMTQITFTCSNSTTGTPEKGVKCDQS